MSTLQGYTTPRTNVKPDKTSNQTFLNKSVNLPVKEKFSEFNSVAEDVIYECPESARNDKQTVASTATTSTTNASLKAEKPSRDRKSPSPLGRIDPQSTRKYQISTLLNLLVYIRPIALSPLQETIL
jgi:hypothetical protein